MIITAKASTIRAAAKRAGELSNLNIRTGRAAEKAEHDFCDWKECSVRVAVLGRETLHYLNEVTEKYGMREVIR